jgi:hypothetical protein
MTEEAPKHETRDVDVKKVFYSGVVFFAIGFGSLFAAAPVFDALKRATRQEELPTAPDLEVRAQPRLDPRVEMKAAAGQELRELLERDRAALSTYGWVDKEAGIAHVPIERAIEALADRLPSRPAATTTTGGGSLAEEATAMPLGESNGFSEGGAP